MYTTRTYAYHVLRRRIDAGLRKGRKGRLDGNRRKIRPTPTSFGTGTTTILSSCALEAIAGLLPTVVQSHVLSQMMTTCAVLPPANSYFAPSRFEGSTPPTDVFGSSMRIRSTTFTWILECGHTNSNPTHMHSNCTSFAIFPSEERDVLLAMLIQYSRTRSILKYPWPFSLQNGAHRDFFPRMRPVLLAATAL